MTVTTPVSVVTTWPAPAGEPASQDFSLSVQGTAVFVYTARVREQIFESKDTLWTHKPDCPADLASFAIFDFTGMVEVVVRPKRAFKSAAVHPISAGIATTIVNGEIRFTMDRPRPLTLLLDGSDDVALHLFAHAPEVNPPKPGDPNVIYFGPGYHDITTLFVASNETLYIAGGAILRAGLAAGEEGTLDPLTKLKMYKGAVISVKGAEKAKVLGRGIVDARALPHPARPTLVSEKSKGVLFEGITIRHSSNWQTIISHSHDVEVRGLQVIGGRLNTDGINTVSSHLVRVHDCFIRSHDDSMAVKTVDADAPASDILYENCVVWNDWGYAMGVNYETRSPISHVTYRNCDILSVRHFAMGVYVMDSGDVTDVTFDNVRIEDMGKAAKRWTWGPKLLKFSNLKDPNDLWAVDKKVAGAINRVRVRNVTVAGATRMAAEIKGNDAVNGVKGVKFENFNYLGKVVYSMADMDMHVNEFISDIQFS